MRLVKIIPHEKFRISLFSFGENYLLQLEAGPMVQGYKVPEGALRGGPEAMIDEQWLSEIRTHFNAMFKSYEAARQRAEGRTLPV